MASEFSKDLQELAEIGRDLRPYVARWKLIEQLKGNQGGLTQ